MWCVSLHSGGIIRKRECVCLGVYICVCSHPLSEHLCDGVLGCLDVKTFESDISNLSLVDLRNSITLTILFPMNQ